MRSLKESLEDQSQLDRICANRGLITQESFNPNDFYGHATVLKDFAHIRQHRQLNVIIPHGVKFDITTGWTAENDSHIQRVWNWQPSRAEYYAQHKEVVTGAAPIVYAAETLRQMGELPTSRDGLIFFPAHSTQHIEAAQDYESLSEKVAALPEKYHPITVCLYWKDYQMGHAAHFQKHGFDIVSAGHMFDTDFTYRWIHLVTGHKYAAGNALGSWQLYATHLGCNSFVIDHDFSHLTDGKEEPEYIRAQLECSLRAEMRAKFNNRKDTKVKKDMARQWLSADLLLSDVELEAVLLA